MNSTGKNPCIICILLLLNFNLPAQHQVKFVLKKLPLKTVATDLYITGNFATWNPGDPSLRFRSTSDNSSLTLDMPAGLYEYKFTRGSWDKVEVTNTGGQVNNRSVRITGDTTIEIIIDGWSDNFVQKNIERRSTASSQVRIYDSAFYVPQLARKKAIRIYIPKDYDKSTKRYPVLYMHDAQNLFDEKTSGFGQEWGVDEAMDSMIHAGLPSMIIVGIDNDPFKRLNEYNPYNHEKFGKAEGAAYLEFIVKTLKPVIDKSFRTGKGRQSTFIAGSSMGGLISFDALIKYPHVFGGAGVFSPAYWIGGKEVEADATRLSTNAKAKVYFYAGGQESESMVGDMKKIQGIFKSRSKSKILERVDEEAKHNEAAWRKWFPEFYSFLVKH